MAAGNPPKVVERAKVTHELFPRFKEWLPGRNAAESARPSGAGTALECPPTGAPPPVAFREWLAARQTATGEEV